MKMLQLERLALTLLLVFVGTMAAAQDSYRVITVTNGGSITGFVRWSGPIPPELHLAVTKDTQVCDPESQKDVSLERLVVGADGGVANTVVFLKNISSGKAIDVTREKYSLDQKRCRYEPHILLVPQGAALQMKSSDPILHIIHMDGAAAYNLAFPFTDHVVSRGMNTSGLVNLRCNAGHLWMNAEMMVVPHPYFAVTDPNGRFELTDVPPGDYQLVAWHEGWHLTSKEEIVDATTHQKLQRPVFSEPRTWEQSITVHAGQASVATFELSEK
jgi:hypothetical protein